MRRSERDLVQAAKKTTRRALIVGGAMTSVVGVLGVRMWQLSVRDAEQYYLLAEENRISLRLVRPDRGRILDRAGKIVADNEQAYRITLVKEEARDVDDVLEKLQVLLGLDAETVSKVKEQIDRVRAFVPVTVKDRVTWEELSIVALNSPVLPGVQPEMVLSRVYPFGPDFAHQVGYVGPVSDSDLENEAADNEPLLRLPDFEVGKTGVERSHERTLRGLPGTRRVEVNVSGRTMRELALDPATPGPDMQITLDHHLQNFMRVRLEGQSAAAIVMDVTNGDLLGCTSAPSFDPNLFVRGISSRDYNALRDSEYRPRLCGNCSLWYAFTGQAEAGMAGFIEGVDRGQSVLFPDRLDDWIGEDSLVRVVDLFVEELDLQCLGFTGSAPARTGRPGYHPAVLLKLFIYGYLNRIPSSRRLEREAGRNVEVMWLTGKLVPDHKTIADFRRDNGAGIRKVCAQFVELCRRIGTLKGDCVAIDGSKFKAVNNRDRNFTTGKIASRIAHLEADVERYITEMVRIDRQEEGEVRAGKVEHLSRRYGRIRQEIARLKEMDQALADAPDGQISLTDPDARSMATSARHSGLVGYNVQSAVDAETHLIVAHEVTNQGFDREQLSPMAIAAKAALGRDDLHAIADKGYFSGPEILACHEAGITTTVPRPATSGNAAKGMYVKADFVYDAERDVYVCPAGEDLTYRYTTEERGIPIRRYWINGCKTCPLRINCTTGNERRISRWEREDLVDDMDSRLGRDPDYMTLRRCTVEHPFGTIKAWMGGTHFLTRRLKNVRSEMALNVLAYNIKRMVALLGVRGLMRAMQG